MPSILFVCTANQFRSPIAAACFSQRLSASATSGTWKVTSAGTWAASNLPAHPQALRSAAKLGLDLSNHLTAEVNYGLLKDNDLIVVMEKQHKEALEIEFPSTIGKIVLLGEIGQIPDGEIPDPAKEQFTNSDEVAAMICSSIQSAFPKLVQFTLLLHDGYSPLLP
jgi:protein-tyrosine phosphatase